MTQRQLFLNHVAQTSDSPLAINMVKAEGSRMWDAEGKEYIDLIAGISVCHVGHRHPRVVDAIKRQADQYLHLMVYGELVENPQVDFARELCDRLPQNLTSVFYTASGSEATEGAMKLAKRFTGRAEVISFKRSYHGSTQGSLSIMGDEYWKQAFRPLLPGIRQLNYNSVDELIHINENTACVIAETVQAEAGVNPPSREWMNALRHRCSETGTLLVLDEIQCGFGRNGTLWAFEQYGIVPDILLLGKALGGGMPLGAFISSNEIMNVLTHSPVLGHINTFGGHPVSCAAGLAAFKALNEENMVAKVFSKEELFLNNLVHPKIRKVTSCGLMIAVWLDSFESNKQVITTLLQEGVFTDWFLFAPEALRIVPPLNIEDEDIILACKKILNAIDLL